ncbi:beta-galactosidase [candidate division KSB1 bacterium]|nr:beta-galactosidase [candidate division KSB1 bacterium]
MIKLFIIVLFVFLFCQKQPPQSREIIDLAGQWQFAIDSTDVGIQQKWYLTDLKDVIELPGTMDLNKKGFLNSDTTTKHLNRVYRYEGPAWYRKKVIIPQEFSNKNIRLILERTKPSKIWIDDFYVGESRLLQSPQYYDVSDYLKSGEHVFTIRIDNDLKLTPYGMVHIYTDETQTNWNGIIGDIFIEAAPRTYISDLQVFPDIDGQKIKVRLAIVNGLGFDSVETKLKIKCVWNGKTRELEPFLRTVPCDSIIQLEYTLGEDMALWDDYEQPLYTLIATIKNDSIRDSKTVPFGMREFTVAGKQFAINGRTTFLRGKNDACVFPLTGHPPMDVKGWKRVYKIAKSYGINYYRFHSYCPPEAAFDAADQLGIFLQPELPFWGGLESDTVAAMLKKEGLAMLKSYANHPSFVMFSAGNEIWSGFDRVEKIIVTLKEKDNRPLYTMGSNNGIGYVGPRPCSDFHIAARTPFAQDTMLTHTRLTHAFVDSRDGGILNSLRPSTTVNFDYAVSQINMPLIGHEVGQYQIYPDFCEIAKYTGVVRARNLEIFRNRLEKAGMLDQNLAFQKASGAWSALCYKAEMEAALRTQNFAGFHLLDLQDFPGQGTALVGILDAFMDSKNVISHEKWLQSCNDVVLLLQFPKYCWQTNENFQAQLKIANYSNKTITDQVEWEIVDQQNRIVGNGTFSTIFANGGLANVGEIKTALDMIKKPEKLTIYLKLKNSGYTNAYPIWVYPVPEKDIEHQGITIAEKLDDEIIARLEHGEKVLLFPTVESVQDNSVAGLFPPDFWNYGMFKGISERANKPISPGTLGILTNPEHPLFNGFPTDSHTNWQWWSIIKASFPMILDKTAHHYRPVVQIIDNCERNFKLGLIFEFAVENGRLLICTARLNDMLDIPEAYHLYKSIINYMESDNFEPDYSVDRRLLSELILSEW